MTRRGNILFSLIYTLRDYTVKMQYINIKKSIHLKTRCIYNQASVTYL